MKKSLRDRVLREIVVDTKLYRYRVTDIAGRYFIQRVRLSALDTTASLDWENIEELK